MSGIQCSFQRCEKKYFLTPAQQQTLLAVMADHTRRDVYGEYTICSTYYDTEDWRLIRASIEKPAYKEKLRMRSYGTPAENGRVFAELKKKCGPGGGPAGPPPSRRGLRPDRQRAGVVLPPLPPPTPGLHRL